MSLMARVNHARSGLQTANDQLSGARGLGKPQNGAPKALEEKGFFDNIGLSDIVHTGLDIAGFVPGLGAVADLANAGLYLAEGDKVNAALSAASAVPGVGDALAAGKLAAKAAVVTGGAAAAVAAAKKLKNSAAPRPPVREGIYVLPAASGKPYVGESVNIDRRLGEHIKSGKLFPENLSKVERTEVLGGKTNREVAEQRKIDELGGIENLDNKRNQIGPKRRHLLDE